VVGVAFWRLVHLLQQVDKIRLLCSHICLILRDHGVYIYVVNI